MFDGLSCRIPTLPHPLPNNHIDSSMFLFFTSFGAGYPEGNSVTIKGWNFTDLDGRPCTRSTAAALLRKERRRFLLRDRAIVNALPACRS